MPTVGLKLLVFFPRKLPALLPTDAARPGLSGWGVPAAPVVMDRKFLLLFCALRQIIDLLTILQILLLQLLVAFVWSLISNPCFLLSLDPNRTYSTFMTRLRHFTRIDKILILNFCRRVDFAINPASSNGLSGVKLGNAFLGTWRSDIELGFRALVQLTITNFLVNLNVSVIVPDISLRALSNFLVATMEPTFWRLIIGIRVIMPPVQCTNVTYHTFLCVSTLCIHQPSFCQIVIVYFHPRNREIKLPSYLPPRTAVVFEFFLMDNQSFRELGNVDRFSRLALGFALITVPFVLTLHFFYLEKRVQTIFKARRLVLTKNHIHRLTAFFLWAKKIILEGLEATADVIAPVALQARPHDPKAKLRQKWIILAHEIFPKALFLFFVNQSHSKITLWSIWQPWLWVNSSGLISWILSSLNELFVTSLMLLTFVSSWSVSTKYINSSWASSCLPTKNRFEILHNAFTNFWGFT